MVGGHARVRSKCDEMIRRLSVVSVSSVFGSPFSPPLAPPRATHGRSSQPASGRRRLVRVPGARPLPRQPDEEPDDERRDDVPRRGGAQLAQPSSRPTRDAPPFAGAGAQLAREPEAARDVRLGDGAGDAPDDVRGERARDARESLRESVLVLLLVLILVLLLVFRALGLKALSERAEAPRRARPERRDGVADVIRGVPRSGVRFRRGRARTPALDPRADAAGVRRGVPVVVASRLPRDARRGGGWFVPFGGGARGAHVDPGSVGRRGGARRRGRGHVGVVHVVAVAPAPRLQSFSSFSQASCDQRSGSDFPRTLRGAGRSRV